MKVKDYKDLKVWQMGIHLADEIYEITIKFPAGDMYGLALQMRRAAVSIPSNIAEGFVRQHTKEYKQFLYVALGSCAELETQLIIAKKRNYISDMRFNELMENINHELRMLTSLANKL